MTIEARLQELQIVLPAPQVHDPDKPYAKWVLHDGLLYVSGHLADRPGELVVRGEVGTDLSLDDARAVARDIALNLLATLQAALGSLDRVSRIVRVLGFVRAAPTFDRHPEVIHAASQVFVDIWGAERGRHARSAIGAGSLPRCAPVEIEMVVAVADGGEVR